MRLKDTKIIKSIVIEYCFIFYLQIDHLKLAEEMKKCCKNVISTEFLESRMQMIISDLFSDFAPDDGDENSKAVLNASLLKQKLSDFFVAKQEMESKFEAINQQFKTLEGIFFYF